MKEFNNFANMKKAISIADNAWQESYDKGIIGVNATPTAEGLFQAENGHDFKLFSVCTYLGLSSHPKVIQGTIDMVRSLNTSTCLTISRNRVKFTAIAELEEALSAHYGATVLTATSCYAASSSLLPLLAAGVFTDDEPPVMVFDKYAHFCMNFLKTACADEARVITCPHDDMEFLENICKEHKRVVYVTDGVNSLGGGVPIDAIERLQNKYGLILFADDSHGLTIFGEKGEGYVKSKLSEFNDKTFIVSSLTKGFGASGAIMMLPKEEYREIVHRYGGPLLWSQPIGSAIIGAAKASLEVQASPELKQLQQTLAQKCQLFDKLIKTDLSGSEIPIRIIRLGDTKNTIDICKALYEKGYYTSAVFFPVAARGQEGLRIMIRAHMQDEHIIEFSELVNQLLPQYGG